MELVKWDDSMSVGSDVFDEHHKILIDCLNDLHPLLGKTDCDDKIASVLGRLEEFVLLHFGEEERMLRQVGYPDWRAHKDQHDQMYDLVFKLKSDVESGRSLEAAYLHEMLYAWLIKHILGDDRKYMDYLENHPKNAKAAG